MNFSPYLMFKGDCEEAMNFYIEILDGKFLMTMRYKEGPPEYMSTPDIGNKIMHTTIQFKGGEIKASDHFDEKAPNAMKHHLSLGFKDETNGEKAFNRLAEGGKITMPFASVFWGGKFGSLVDKFGVQWMVSGGGM